MKTKLSISIVLLLALLLAYQYIIKDFEKSKSTIYFNADIITLDEKVPTAKAMLIEDGIIKAIGGNDEVLKLKNSKIKTVDLNGVCVIPGFIDGHTHVALSTFLEGMIDLSGFKHKTNKEVWAYLKEKIKESKPGEWVVCKGIDPILVEDLKSPTLSFMDEISPDNPLVMLSQSLHNYWANSKAFEKVGIIPTTENPSKSSYYERDKEGNLTGLIVEQKAFVPFINQMKKDILTPKTLMDYTTRVLKKYAKNGNTTVVSAGITINDAKPLRLYDQLSNISASFVNQLLAKFGFLPKREQYPRHFIYIRYDKAFLLPEKKKENDFYNIIGIKHWYDGSPYAGSMYLNEAYLVSDLTKNVFHISENHRGKSLITPKELKKFIKKYNTMGWQIAIHAQGDAANDEILQSFKEISKELDITSFRNRLEHCILLSDSALSEMKSLNITPSFHINHLYYYGKALKNDVIGKERASKILRVATAQNKHMIYSLHADQPMFESKPFRLIQTAVERKTKEGDT